MKDSDHQKPLQIRWSCLERESTEPLAQPKCGRTGVTDTMTAGMDMGSEGFKTNEESLV